MAMMNSTAERASTTPSKNSKRGWIVLVGGVAVAVSAAMMSGTGWLPKGPATVAQPVQTVAVDTGKVCEDGNCTTQAAINAQLARLALPEKVLLRGGNECRYVDDIGYKFCVVMLSRYGGD